MKILFDHNVTRKLRSELPAYDITTAAEMGWQALANGELIPLVQAHFQVFITADQPIALEHCLSDFQPLHFVFLEAPTNTIHYFRTLVPEIKQVLDNPGRSQVSYVTFPGYTPLRLRRSRGPHQ